MEDSVKNRLIEFLNSEKIKKSQFCDMIGVHPNYVDNMRKSVSVEKLDSIAEKFPNLNLDWLLRGKGEMLKNNQTVGNIEHSTAVGVNVYGSNNKFPKSIENSAESIKFYQNLVEKQHQQIEKQLIIIENLSKYGK